MVSWYGDGTVSGWDNASLSDTRHLLASDGVVPLNGVTRLQYALPSTRNNSINAVAPLRFTSSDVSLNSGKRLTASMFIASSAHFAPGVTPTVDQILAVGPSLRVFRAGSSRATAGDISLTIRGPKAETLQPNTKYWVLVMPTAVSDMSLPPNYVNDVPLRTASPPYYDSRDNARGVSLWTNRTPAQPVITAPMSGTTVTSGSSVDFTFTSNDPDAVVGSAHTNYLDLAGVQIQYAEKPKPGSPSPVWKDLPIAATVSPFKPGDGWYIDRSSKNEADDGALGLWANQTLQIKCGGSATASGKGLLPSGDWQIRVRTFDYGHPYSGDFFPLGRTSGDLTPSNYPVANTSPWSDPVNISVLAQVPPPIPLDPTDSEAVVENNPVTLQWQYRNAHNPPLEQASADVQIRKVGGAWVTLPSVTSGKYVTIDSSATERVTNGGFESDFTGWTGTDSVPPPSANINTVAPFEGTKNLRIIEQSGESDQYHVEPWQYVNVNPGSVGTLRFAVRDSGGAAKPRLVILWFADGSVTPLAEQTITPVSGNQWSAYEHDLTPPAGAVRFMLTLKMVPATSIPEGAWVDWDAISYMEQAIRLTATNEYEWRVRATDTDGLQSDWSETARFWIVPEPASGEVRPLPVDTIDGATLGVGKHRVYIYRRGGTVRVGEITDISYLDWSRVRDDISTSKIVVKGWDLDGGNLLAELQTWAYEVVITRSNGFESERVWEGPITLLTYKDDEVVIHAKDVLAYLYRRIIRQAMNDRKFGASVVTRAARIVQNAFAPDDPNVLRYLQIIARADDAVRYRSTPAYSRTAYEEIDDMAANAGLDYTAVGRAILLWGTKHRIGTLPEFRDSDLGSSPVVSEYGMSAANHYSVSDGNGVHGGATRAGITVEGDVVSGNDPIYGLIEMLSSTWADDSEVDTGTYTEKGRQTVIESFKTSAERSIADRYPPPVVVRVPDNTTLNPDTPISIQHLVPGVIVPLRSTGTLRSVSANQKLDSVKVVEESGSEKISVTLSPFSRDDAQTVEGGDE